MGKILLANGNGINAVLLLISRMGAFTTKYKKDKDLGAFYRSLTYNLQTCDPDESEAGIFARELLEAAKMKYDKKAKAGALGGLKKAENEKGRVKVQDENGAPYD